MTTDQPNQANRKTMALAETEIMTDFIIIL